MNKQDLFDLIESYLDGSLPEDRRQELEQRMVTDEAFRREVELHQELQVQFSDPGRLRLRTALEDILEEPPQPADPPLVISKNWWKWAALIVLVLSLGIWQWRKNPAVPQTPDPDKKQLVEPPLSPVNENPKSIPKKIPQVPTPSKPKPSANKPIAQIDPADFAPNYRMEGYIGNVRGEGAIVNVTEPHNDANFISDGNDSIFIIFRGIILIPPNRLKNFKLYLFKNHDIDTPLDSLHVRFMRQAGFGKESAEPERIEFFSENYINLSRGLYYFTVEQAGEMLYVGKFTIGKPAEK